MYMNISDAYKFAFSIKINNYNTYLKKKKTFKMQTFIHVQSFQYIYTRYFIEI